MAAADKPLDALHPSAPERRDPGRPVARVSRMQFAELLDREEVQAHITRARGMWKKLYGHEPNPRKPR